jgi:DUF1365 family protein
MSTAPIRSCIYQGRVMHHRLRPVQHRFVYRVFSVFLDLDELPALNTRLRLFSVERRNLLSFRAADHGDRDGTALHPWVTQQLAASGIALVRPRIMLLCFPRVLGYAFNPLSIYFCYDDDRLTAIVYEVKNTFGGQHAYVFPVQREDNHRRLTAHGCDKNFSVSPFIDMEARYEFDVAVPDQRLCVVIRESERGAPLLVASQVGRRRPLTDTTIFACLAVDLFMTFKVFVGIHVEALRLWLRGVPLLTQVTRPASADADRTR